MGKPVASRSPAGINTARITTEYQKQFHRAFPRQQPPPLSIAMLKYEDGFIQLTSTSGDYLGLMVEETMECIWSVDLANGCEGCE